MTIRVGILGYGNLGRGVECAVKHNPDMELAAVFTRRDPGSLTILTEGAKVLSAGDAPSMKDDIDVMILCGGSATDLPKQTPDMARYFNVIDSFDTHANIPQLDAADKAAKEADIMQVIICMHPVCSPEISSVWGSHPAWGRITFWGKGVSQASDIRRIWRAHAR